MASETEQPRMMLPLWLAFPDIPRYSIGWRMGEGESYAYEFLTWWDELSPAMQQEYQRRYPEPVNWRGWYREEEGEDEGGAEKTEGYELDGF